MLPRKVRVGKVLLDGPERRAVAAEKPRSRPSTVRTAMTPEPIAGAARISLPMACRQRSSPVSASSASKIAVGGAEREQAVAEPGPAVRR